MPQNPLQYLPAADPDNRPKPLRVDDNGALITISGGADPTTVSIVQQTGTLGADTTFQLVEDTNADRLPGGVIVNTSSKNAMGVFFGAVGDAKAAAAVPIAASGTLSLGTILGGTPYDGPISINGTKSDVFVSVLPKKA